MTAEERFKIKLRKKVLPHLGGGWQYIAWFNRPIEAVWNNSPKVLAETRWGRHKLRMYLLSAGIKV